MPRLRITMSAVLCALLLTIVMCRQVLGQDSKNVVVMEVQGPLCEMQDHCVCNMSYIQIQCHFADTQKIVLTSESFQQNTQTVSVKGGQYVDIQKDTFLSTKKIDSITLEGIKLLRIRSNALRKISPNNLKLIVADCEHIHFENKSFDVEGPITASISNCSTVHIEKDTFKRIIKINITDVRQLELDENSFHFNESYNLQRHGPAAKIFISNSIVPILPMNTFVSSVGGITIENCTIQKIHSSAFSAMEIVFVKFVKLHITDIEENAFKPGCLINNFTIFESTIDNLHHHAVSPSGFNISLHHSRFKNVAKGAFYLHYVNVLVVNNTFNKIGLEVLQWTNIIIKGNTIHNLSNRAIDCPNNTEESKEFIFSNNNISNIENSGLEFLTHIPRPLLHYENNSFKSNCCHIDIWLKNLYRNESTELKLYTENSYCFIKADGNMMMKNFTDKYCTVSEPSIDKKVHAHKIEFIEDQFVDSNEEFPHKYILISVLSLVVCGIAIIMMYIGCVKAKRRGCCSNVKNAVTSSNSSCFTFFDRLLGINYGMDTARSISRVSVNDYNENHILHETRTLNEDNTTLIDETRLDDLVETYEKSTQTLPEELTKELLESLREKLDDPDNYKEARETIEHLYDLIKVEEYCNSNNNNKPTTSRVTCENLYDVIQIPCRTYTGKNKKSMVSVGTRVPSFNKLPQSSPYNRQTALCHDYFEPQDHLYSELPENKYSDISSQYNLVDEVLNSTPHNNYLRAIEKSMSSSRPLLNDIEPQGSVAAGPSGINSHTHRSNKSNHSGKSDTSASKMANRPLPEKPILSRARNDFFEGPPPPYS